MNAVPQAGDPAGSGGRMAMMKPVRAIAAARTKTKRVSVECFRGIGGDMLLYIDGIVNIILYSKNTVDQRFFLPGRYFSRESDVFSLGRIW